MSNLIHSEDLRLSYNLEQPQERFKAAGVKAALVKNASDRLPSPVPWPAGKAPTPDYGVLTSAASVIASWAAIDAILN